MRSFRFWVTFLGTLVLDQACKMGIILSIEAGTYIDPPPIPILDSFFFIVHIHNTGAAWGILPGQGVIFIVLAVFILSLIYRFRQELFLYSKCAQYVWGLLCGGVIGNVIDRILYGYVIDFIDLHFFAYRFPAFNIADSGITIGVIGIMIQTLWSKKIHVPNNQSLLF